MALELKIIVASTRPGRVGIHVGKWFEGVARQNPAFAVELVDLLEVNLPLYDEPKHPRLRDYQHEHTRAWSAVVDSADAFVFVTPEYNYSPTPALTNALDYVFTEWAHKPAAFVSYGGVSGGLRAVQATKVTLSALSVVTINDAVVAPFVSQQVKDGAFAPNEVQAKAAEALLKQLARYAEALKPLRAAG